jgi:hypothetical protein
MYIAGIVYSYRKVKHGNKNFEDEIHERQDRGKRQSMTDTTGLQVRKRKASRRVYSERAADMLSFSGLQQPILESMESTMRTQKRLRKARSNLGSFSVSGSTVPIFFTANQDQQLGRLSSGFFRGSRVGATGRKAGHNRTFSDAFSDTMNNSNGRRYSSGANFPMRGFPRVESSESIGSHYLHGWQDTPSGDAGRVFFAGHVASPSRKQRKAAYAVMGDINAFPESEQKSPLPTMDGSRGRNNIPTDDAIATHQQSM